MRSIAEFGGPRMVVDGTIAASISADDRRSSASWFFNRVTSRRSAGIAAPQIRRQKFKLRRVNDITVDSVAAAALRCVRAGHEVRHLLPRLVYWRRGRNSTVHEFNGLAEMSPHIRQNGAIDSMTSFIIRSVLLAPRGAHFRSRPHGRMLSRVQDLPGAKGGGAALA
jgi:hypothetical protein